MNIFHLIYRFSKNEPKCEVKVDVIFSAEDKNVRDDLAQKIWDEIPKDLEGFNFSGLYRQYHYGGTQPAYEVVKWEPK